MASFDEMEAKRQMMITSFTQIANAMRQCVACIEDYTRHDPGNVPSRNTTQHALAQLQGYPQGIEAIDPRLMDQPQSNTAPQAPAQTPAQATPTAKKTKAATAAAAAAAVEKPAKKEKKIKDPNQPKRPASAYILYQNDVRPNLQSLEAEMSYQDAMKKVSGMWKELTPAQKKPYEEKYAKAIEEYQQKDKAYKAGQGNESVAPGTVDPSALSGNRAVPAAAATSDSSDSSDSSSDSSDDEPPPPPAPKVKTPKAPAAVPPTPTTLAAVASTPKTATKEKKRKHKDVAPAAVAGTPITPATGEKKKKKKSKD